MWHTRVLLCPGGNHNDRTHTSQSGNLICASLLSVRHLKQPPPLRLQFLQADLAARVSSSRTSCPSAPLQVGQSLPPVGDAGAFVLRVARTRCSTSALSCGPCDTIPLAPCSHPPACNIHSPSHPANEPRRSHGSSGYLRQQHVGSGVPAREASSRFSAAPDAACLRCSRQGTDRGLLFGDDAYH